MRQFAEDRRKLKELITVVPQRLTDVSVFSPEELDLVNSIIESFRGWRGGTLSKSPYETIFFGPDQRLSDEEIKFGP